MIVLSQEIFQKIIKKYKNESNITPLSQSDQRNKKDESKRQKKAYMGTQKKMSLSIEFESHFQ